MPKLILTILRPDQTSDLLTFEQTTVLVGREGGDLVTGDPEMSNRHAEFSFSSGVLMFEDLKSTNGSFRINGERITTPIPITPGTALRLGGSTLTVQDVQTGFERGGTAVMPQVDQATAAPPVAPSPAPEQPSPVNQATAAAPPPAPAGAAGPAPIEAPASPPIPAGEAPAGGDLIAQFKSYLSTGADIYKAHYLGGVMTIGLVMVPGALLSALSGLIPVVGWLLAILVSLAQLALAPLSAGAMGRWALAAASGRTMTWQQAWSAALKNPVSEWINVAVSMFISTIGTMLLIVPGIIVGMFALPAYLLENKSLVSINMRSAELVMKDPARHIGLGFLAILLAVPVMIAASIVGMIVAFVPVIGSPLTSVISVAFSMTVAPFVYLLWSLVYFDTRKQLEGADPSQVHQATLDSWSH